MKKILRYHFILIVAMSLGMIMSGCLSKRPGAESKRKPDWVQQRPTNTLYYVGIGYANKINNAGDYQRVAKKNALDDMIGEVKVTVSSNSILSQYQNNQNFSQQFFSDTRMIASETMEGFQVVDSWENKTDYWIYYRMSKDDYEAYKRRKLNEAIDKALDLMNRADQLDVRFDYVQSFKLRVKAAGCLQNYMNESIEATYKRKDVYLLNEIISQLQDQLLRMQIKVDKPLVNATAGKAIESPIVVRTSLKQTDTNTYHLAYIPLKMEGNGVKFRGNNFTETQEDGSAQFAIGSVQSRDPVQVLQVKPDLDRLLRGDSLNNSMKKLLQNLELPVSNIRLKVEPIRILMVSRELNLDQNMKFNILEPALKKKLMEQGCTFVQDSSKADYLLNLSSNTHDQGVMWREMLKSSADLELVLVDARTKSEIFKDALTDILGYQVTKEKAGMEAYQALMREMMKRTYPQLESKLFFGE